MRPTADLVVFNEEIFNRRLHFLCIAGGYWSCSSGDKKKLINQVTSQNHVIEVSCNFMSGNFSLYLITMPSLVAIDIVIVKICFLLVT